jgi:ABC-type glycerol-3-phosphate transport system substrate-binding protein
MILRTVAALLVGGLALAACGSESSDSGGERQAAHEERGDGSQDHSPASGR